MNHRSRNDFRGKKQRPSKPAKKKHKSQSWKSPATPSDPEVTGAEAAYMKRLVEAETPVVIVLSSGEHLRGFVRYYDRDIFSLGPIDGGPKLLLRKSSIRYLFEEAEAE